VKNDVENRSSDENRRRGTIEVEGSTRERQSGWPRRLRGVLDDRGGERNAAGKLELAEMPRAQRC